MIQAFGQTQYLTNVTLSAGSNLRVQNDALYANTTLTNNGTITLGGAAGTADLRSEGANLAINGTGTIVLDNSAGAARIFGGNITFGAGQTVQGAGSLGLNQTLFTINNVFSANSGSNLSIDVTGGNGGVGAGNGVGTGGNAGLLNNSTIQATGGSTLSFEGGLYENSATGVIQALAGSTVSLNNDSRILNGTLTSVGSGVINAVNANQYLTNVTLSAGSNLRVQNDALYANTTLTNNGTITLGGSAGTADLRSESPNLTISGTGTIVLDNSLGAARIFGGNITFGSNQSLRGGGQLGVNQTIITNNGLFSANSGSSLSIDVTGGNGGVGNPNGVGTNLASGLLNNNIIEATGGSTISLEGGLYENALGGIIRATNNSFINLNNDLRILNGTLTSDATSVIQAFGQTQYLTNVTLSAGSNLRVQNDALYANTTLTNNGTITLGGAAGTADLRSEGANLAINGTGTIVLDNSAGAARIFTGNITVGAGQTVQGAGSLGLNQTIFTNDGLISADAGTGISIDVSGGNGGVGAGNGVGTGGNAGLVNFGNMSGVNGGTLSFEGGLYENGDGGRLFANANGTVVFNNDASYFNLKSRGILDTGRIYAQGYGGAGTINLRSNAANVITTIGTASGPSTEVILEGAGSVVEVTPFGGGAPVTIDQTLTGVAASGVFALHDRNFTVVAGGGNFSNAGLTFVNNTVFTSNSFTNSGTLFSDATSSLTAPITNSGTILVSSGTLSTQAITGATGTIQTNAAATLNLGGNSTAGFLTNNGTLALGTRNVTVTTDYTNANFGSGNAFNNHANVTGTGQILALSATMNLSGAGLSGNNLNVGNVRIGGTSGTTLTITNNGASTNLIGAVKNSAAPGISLTGADWTAAAGGGTANVGLSFNGVAAGSLAGQTLNVVNNFDNVASRTLNVIGAAYNAATASVTPNPVTLGNARIGGTLSGTVTIANTAPAGLFSEGLAVTGATATGSASAGATPSGLIAAGSSQTTGVQLSTATAGAKTGTVTYGLATDGAGTSGLAQSAITSQGVTVNGSVFAVANPLINNASSFLNIGPVLVGSVVTRTLDISNVQLAGALGFQEGLNVGWGSVTGNSIAGTVGSITNLAAGGTNSSNLVLTFDTSSAGAKVGAVDILLTSNGLGTSGLGLFGLTSQSLAVTGQVNSIVNVLNPAVATIVTSTPITIADQRVGGSGSASLTIRNDGIGPSAGLDGSYASATSTATGTGSFANIASGSTSNAISVGVNTSAAGARGGVVTLDFASNLSPNPNVALPSQTVSVSGNVYQAAVAGAQPSTVTLGARRVGDAAASSVLTIANTAPVTAGFNEALTSNLSVGSGFSLNGGEPPTWPTSQQEAMRRSPCRTLQRPRAALRTPST
ncbi:MAG: choice-of-anchor D domain-containing protein [Sphingomonadales bacterium]|nr:choice-of-anchor D domain-containing protein [Sphingomonadales bacterium]